MDKLLAGCLLAYVVSFGFSTTCFERPFDLAIASKADIPPGKPTLAEPASTPKT